MSPRHEVLVLNSSGAPQGWVSARDAAEHYVNDAVLWTEGESPLITLRGGFNSRSGRQSLLEIHPIIALKGSPRINLFDITPSLTNAKLFRRDLMVCCLCGEQFSESELTREHIIPRSRGGPDQWSNCAAACRFCNGRKGDRLLSEIKAELVYLPYTPSVWEDVILRSKVIRGDVNEWLVAKLPKGSRLC